MSVTSWLTPGFFSFRVSASVGFFIKVTFGVFMFASLRRRVKKAILWPLLFVFLVRSDGEVNEMGSGHFVVVIEVGMLQTDCITGREQQSSDCDCYA